MDEQYKPPRRLLHRMIGRVAGYPLHVRSACGRSVGMLAATVDPNAVACDRCDDAIEAGL